MPDQIDETYFRSAPQRHQRDHGEEVQELAFIFGVNGELAAERLG